MRRLLSALPFALLPFAFNAAAHEHSEHSHEHSHEHQHEEHGSLGAHVHGVAELNVALDGSTLELQLQSPAMNLLGFEHAAQSAEDKAKVAAVQKLLEQPLSLFGLNEGQCTLTDHELESPLFESNSTEKKHEEHAHSDTEHAHNDIHAHYQLACEQPDNLKQLDLTELFQRFPATEKIKVQLIGPSGQNGQELTAATPALSF